MEMDMHHFLSRAGTIVLNDVAFLNSRRCASGAGDAGEYSANPGC